MNIAVVGTNFISDRFVTAAMEARDVNIGAVYSRKSDTGAAFARKYGIERVYTDYREMLFDESLDAVYIASPTMCHRDQASDALRAGLAVLCEKAVCATYGEFLSLDRVRRETGGIIIEAMRPDFDMRHSFIKSNISALGEIRGAELEYRQYSSRYDSFLRGTVMNAFDPKMKNSALADIGIYPLHCCVSLFGEPLSVSSTGEFLHNGFLARGESVLNYGTFDVKISYSKIDEGENVSVIRGERCDIRFDRINEPTYVKISAQGREYVYPKDVSEYGNMDDEICAFRDIVSGVRTDADKLWDTTARTMRTMTEIYSELGVDF